MIRVIAFALMAEFLFFLSCDFIRNRGNGSERLLVRMASGTLGVVLLLVEIFVARDFSMQDIVADVVLSTEVLLVYPCSFEKPSLPVWTAFPFCILAALSSLGLAVIPSGYSVFRSQRLVWTFVLVVTTTSLYFSVVAFRRLREIRLFFRNSAVWYNVEDYSRFLYSMAFLSLCVLILCADSVPGDAGRVCLLLCFGAGMALYAVLFLRAMTGKTFVLDHRTEKRIKDIIKGNLRTSFIDKAEEDRMMNNLYRKVMFLMSEKKPYLDPSFCMSDLAEQVYSNKLYLSRTINILSGRNFRQFLNYHRVQYAISLFKKDPRLKVAEAAEMSGFHSTVSFNMAFKINTGKTPSEWLQEHQGDLH